MHVRPAARGAAPSAVFGIVFWIDLPRGRCVHVVGGVGGVAVHGGGAVVGLEGDVWERDCSWNVHGCHTSQPYTNYI